MYADAGMLLNTDAGMLLKTDSFLDPLVVCCGEKAVKGRSVLLTSAALAEFKQIDACPPKDPAKFALRLLPVFFSDEELGRSNCTKAEGRDLLDQEVT